jgi:hypothetical protein
MAITPINAPRGPDRGQGRQEESDMDKLFKALSIANQGMGIAVNYQKVQDIREGRELRPGIEADRAEQHEATLKQTKTDTAFTAGPKTESEKALAGQRKEAGAASAAAAKLANTKYLAESAQARTDQEQQLFNDFRTDRRNLKAFESMDNASKAFAALVGDPKNASQLQVSAAQRMIIRSIEPGIINAADLQAYSPDASAMTRMERALSLQAEGKPLEMDAQAFKDFATLLQNKAADDLRKAGAAFANSPQGAKFGATDEVMQRVLRVEDFVAKAPLRPLGDQSPSTAGFNIQGQDQGGAPPPPAPAFSEEDINAVMQGGNFSRGEAIQRLRQAQGGGQ